LLVVGWQSQPASAMMMRPLMLRQYAIGDHNIAQLMISGSQKRPRGCRAAEQRDEIASVHASDSNEPGTAFQ
jgi:hypothetical protein